MIKIQTDVVKGRQPVLQNPVVSGMPSQLFFLKFDPAAFPGLLCFHLPRGNTCYPAALAPRSKLSHRLASPHQGEAELSSCVISTLQITGR